MKSASPFAGQPCTLFSDTFSKWPARFFKIFILLLATSTVLFYYQPQLDYQLHQDLCFILIGLKILIMLWGLLLKFRSRAMWYRKYHLGKGVLFIGLSIAIEIVSLNLMA
uniref:hypothetical protein n=1 Tax=Thaumasiovibrio occultus TaxID=1891184 RepID=UPI000B35B1DD|nr:hypothetical protein [Thaumasiovibrio occultus]